MPATDERKNRETVGVPTVGVPTTVTIKREKGAWWTNRAAKRWETVLQRRGGRGGDGTAERISFNTLQMLAALRTKPISRRGWRIPSMATTGGITTR